VSAVACVSHDIENLFFVFLQKSLGIYKVGSKDPTLLSKKKSSML
jgi:hypothetical protein